MGSQIFAHSVSKGVFPSAIKCAFGSGGGC